MNRLKNLLTSPFTLPHRLHRRFRESRPGSVLILVVALLVLLTIMGTAYISATRIERAGVVNGNSERLIKNATAAFVSQLTQEVTSNVVNNAAKLETCATGGDVFSLPFASRSPRLLPDLTSTSNLAYNAPNVIPVWPAISRKQDTPFDSPWVATNPAQYPNAPTSDFVAPTTLFYAPTNIVVNYGTNAPNPDLLYQTRTFPALTLYERNGNTASYTVSGPFLAGDASGMGIADCGLRLLSNTPVGGVYFYGGIRLIDNGSALNVNTAYSSRVDIVSANYNSCYNFFPCDLDLQGLMYSTGAPSEMAKLNTARFKGGAVTYIDDSSKPHGDMNYLNGADSFWMNLGRRPNNPSSANNFGYTLGTVATYERPFPDSDGAAFAYHGGLVNQNSPLQRYDTLMKGSANNHDAIFAGAPNAASNASNYFNYFAANNVGYLYDWNWNFESAKNNSGMAFPIANFGTTPLAYASTAGVYNNAGASVPFRGIRSLVVSSNPVANLCRFVDQGSLPTNATSPTVPGAAVIGVMDTVHPHKASLNTDDFPALWRAFVNVMAANSADNTGVYKFTVPTDPSAGGANGGSFRNVLRAPDAGSTAADGFSSPINSASNVMDSKNVLLLRSALAAVNVMTLRNMHGVSGATNREDFIPDPVRQVIDLKAGTQDVQVLVYGVTAHPYIVEVYANTDIADHTGPTGKVKNEMGFVAIKLYNPYPYAINLKDYALVLVDRKSGSTYPAMAVKKFKALDTSALATAGSIPSNSSVTLTNFDGATATSPTSQWWPDVIGPTPLADHIVKVPDLYNAIDQGMSGTGGEVVLLRALNANTSGNPEVPVDSFDLTGFKNAKDPKRAIAWHYVRNHGDIGTPANRWKCIYPGTYTGSRGQSMQPRQEGTHVEAEWDPANPDPWIGIEKVYMNLKADFDIPSIIVNFIQNPFPGIQLCNADFGGFNKFKSDKVNIFPFGGFARVGDVIHAPFIGSYIVMSSPIAGISQGVGLPQTMDQYKVTEINPVTMDAIVADDGDAAASGAGASDNADEHIGRFSAIQDAVANDYSMWGHYNVNDPPLVAAPTPLVSPSWRYHFATRVYDQFTVVCNPESDYFPNMNPVSYVSGTGGSPPVAVPNSTGAIGNANKNEYATEGLLNINTADWRTLAAIEMIPNSVGGNAPYAVAASNPNHLTANAMLAQFIVRYRDVDDGTGRNPAQGHGAFTSLAELNDVFDPANRANTFANMLGILPASAPVTDPTYFRYGNYAPNPTLAPLTATSPYNNHPAKDFIVSNSNLMISRISNLVTLRSDTFTAYVIVQGWRNVGTAYPELVAQKRAALLIDRSALGFATGTAANQTPRTYSIPSD